VTAGDGGVVVRVFPGMSLGETETGELSLEGGDALLSLSIGSDESLVVFVVNGGELESEDGELGARRHLAFDSAAEILLPNNILRFDQDMLSQTGKDAPSLPRAVWRKASTEDLPPVPSNIGPTQLPPLLSEFDELLSEFDELELNAPKANGSASSAPMSSSPKSSAPIVNAPKPSVPELNAVKPSTPELSAAKPSAPELRVPKTLAPKPTAPKPSAAKLNAPKPSALELRAPKSPAHKPSAPKTPALKRDQPKSVAAIKERPTPHAVPGNTPGSDKKRQRAIVAAASAGLVCVLIGLVYSGTRTAGSPEQSARQIAVVEASRPKAVKGTVQAAVEEAPTITLKPKSKPVPAPIAAQATVAPETAAPEKTLAIATSVNELKARDTTSTNASAAAKPFTQARPTPEIAERTAFKSTPQSTSQNRLEKTAETSKNSGSRQTNRNPVSRREVAEADTARTAVKTNRRSGIPARRRAGADGPGDVRTRFAGRQAGASSRPTYATPRRQRAYTL